MILPLSKIVIDNLQARAATDPITIDEYAVAFANEDKFPPVVVFNDGTSYFLADGFHRYFGAQKSGLDEIEVDVRTGTREDALWFAVAANQSHGLKRTNADKRKAVTMALAGKPNLSNNAIALHVGVSDMLVAEVRGQVQVLAPQKQSLPKSAPQLPPQMRTGLDSKSYPVPSAPLPIPATSKSKPPVAPKPIIKLDATGWPIPEGILQTWIEAEALVKSVLLDIGKWRVQFDKMQKEKPVMWAETNANSVFADLSNALNSIKQSLPYAICLKCQGLLPTDCPRCKGRGFVSELFWKHESQTEKDFRAKLLKANHEKETN